MFEEPVAQCSTIESFQHAAPDTTNLFAELDLEIKTKALALCDAAELGSSRLGKENQGLIAFLKSL